MTSFLSDPGGIIYLCIAAVVFVGLFKLTHPRRRAEPAEDDEPPRRSIEDIARGGPF